MVKSIKNVRLWFADGSSFAGQLKSPFGEQSNSDNPFYFGEAVFTTAQTGYIESITDPSYLNQHLVFASPHIGSYPMHSSMLQSMTGKSFCSSIWARRIHPFQLNSPVPLIESDETRFIVEYLRDSKLSKNSILDLSGEIPFKTIQSLFLRQNIFTMNTTDVSVRNFTTIKEGNNPVIIWDFGVKTSIIQSTLKCIQKQNIGLVIAPFSATSAQILALNPSLILLSNGPGDPKIQKNAINAIRELISNVNSCPPLRGICLGHQLLALALGGETGKLPYGHRGINHPVWDVINQFGYITSQNHGHEVISNSKISQFVSHISLFDRSVEGLTAPQIKLKSVQYHPEGNPGPPGTFGFESAGAFFDNLFEDVPSFETTIVPKVKPLGEGTILVIGAGPIRIGQACEFDYSGTQACLALKKKGFRVVLINPNPATIMTDEECAHRTYLDPIREDMLIEIIKKENVQYVLPTMGGQTALNACLQLSKNVEFQSLGVVILGPSAKTIQITEDRILFAAEVQSLGYKAAHQWIFSDIFEAKTFIKNKINLGPYLIRRSFALGGQGAIIIPSASELANYIEHPQTEYPLILSPSLVGEQEIELEILIDQNNQGVVVCGIENIDPCGIHTGDSITVAPTLTVSDSTLQLLRNMALKMGRHLKLIGGANIQFAIPYKENPLTEDDITIIEMNPRVSRSSALASKVTGVPIAHLSALISVGYSLSELSNEITGNSSALFEPTLDYVAVKIPLFPFAKFPQAKTQLGPMMRSVGESLGIGGTFTEAFFKALRGLEYNFDVPHLRQLDSLSPEQIKTYLRERLKRGEELSLLTVMEALRRDFKIQEIFELSHIHPFYLTQLKEIIEIEIELKETAKNNSAKFPSSDLLRQSKKWGFSDKWIAHLLKMTESDVASLRNSSGIRPHYYTVDTCSGEFIAKTPYYYSSYHAPINATHTANHFKGNTPRYLILGSGPNRIGQGLEFDYSCVKACLALKEIGHEAIMVNCNPETVSTDYNMATRLYIAPLYAEDIADLILHEKPIGLIIAFSGQTGIKILQELPYHPYLQGLPANFYCSAHSDTLNTCEDRLKFAQFLNRAPFHRLVKTLPFLYCQGNLGLRDAIKELGLPVILRPSYVIGGESMMIINQLSDLDHLPPSFNFILQDNSTMFLVEPYLDRAVEYDLDFISDSQQNFLCVIGEHIERAGVHSGDSGMYYPPLSLSNEQYQQMIALGHQISIELNLVGPINLQLVWQDGNLYCIEANPRGSRTIPFFAKATGINLVREATRALLGLPIDSELNPKFFNSNQTVYFVKQATFPFEKFPEDVPLLGPRMLSTGETIGIAQDFYQAVKKSHLANYSQLDRLGLIFLSLSNQTKNDFLPWIKKLQQMGFTLAATRGTKQFLAEAGMESLEVPKISEMEKGEIPWIFFEKDLRFVMNTPSFSNDMLSDGQLIRKYCAYRNIACFTHPDTILMVMKSLTGASSKGPQIPALIALQDLKLKTAVHKISAATLHSHPDEVLAPND